MLEDSYCEWLVAKKQTPVTTLLKVLIIIAGVFLLLVGLIFAGQTYSFTLLLGVGAMIGAFFLSKSLNIEYEYIFTSGELNIDKVTDQQRRKTVLKVDMQSIELVAKYQSGTMSSYRNNQDLKVTDYSSQKDPENVYALVCTGNENRGIYLFDPNEKMLKMMRNYAPRKIIMG
ncbi:MAG: hypothetical protein J5825_09665 [Lachnospiraceae bacterium]|nr:hypothetical protein [Lachnospiraceae bacterium]